MCKALVPSPTPKKETKQKNKDSIMITRNWPFRVIRKPPKCIGSASRLELWSLVSRNGCSFKRRNTVFDKIYLNLFRLHLIWLRAGARMRSGGPKVCMLRNSG
jgi:hypothetical protein